PELYGEVGGHRVDIVRQTLPGAGHAGHLCLTAQFAFRAYFTRHAGYFGGEGIELIHHRVDGLFELEDFTAHIHGDLARQVAGRDGGGDVGDVPYLSGEVAGHGVDVVGQILPGAGHAFDFSLPAQLAFGADLAGDAADLRGERVQLVHHRVDGVLEFENFTAHVHRDLALEVAVGDGGGDFGDVSHLGREVVGHRIDVVGQILPGAGHAFDFSLPAQLAFRAHFAGHTRDFRSKRVQLVHHGVHGVFEFKDFAFDIHGDLAREIAARHGGGDLGDVADLGRQIAGHG